MSNKPSGVPEHSAARRPNVLEPARPSFDTVTITLHWISLLLVLAMMGTGLPYGPMGRSALGTPLALRCRDDVLETMAPILRRKRELISAATSVDSRKI